MSTKSREVIFGSRIAGARIRAQGARERARQEPRGRSRRGRSMVHPNGRIWRTGATLTDDRAMPQWRLRLAAGEMPPLRNRGQHSARTCPPAARYADLETRGGAEMPIMPNAAILAAGAHDPAHRRTADRALCLGAPGRR